MEEEVTLEALWKLCEQVKDLCVETLPKQDQAEELYESGQHKGEEEVEIDINASQKVFLTLLTLKLLYYRRLITSISDH